jgi:mannose-6-phosphate isomerase-like protein (cupin superfamily)
MNKINDLSSKIEKPWGWEEILEKNDKYVVKLLHVNAGQRLSLQYHGRKTETLFMFAGEGYVSTPYESRFFDERLQKIHMPPGQMHRVAASATIDMELLEVSTPELDDVVRIEDDYGRSQ